MLIEAVTIKEANDIKQSVNKLNKNLSVKLIPITTENNQEQIDEIQTGESSKYNGRK
jgi:protein subunit release factor A